MRIIGPPSATIDVVRLNLPKGATPLFRGEMFSELWQAGIVYEIDPVGLIAQSLKETGLGAFTGKVKPDFYNTAGIKNRHLGLFPGIDDGDNPLAHARFASWEVGAHAQAQHVCAYAGMEVVEMIVDPRYVWVAGKHALENWSELGGKWAPSPTYGKEIEDSMRVLRGQ